MSTPSQPSVPGLARFLFQRPLLSSCLFLSVSFASPSAAQDPVDAKLAPGDHVLLYVLGTEGFSGIFPVSAEGTIRIPVAGKVVVKEFTWRNTAEGIRKVLEVNGMRDVVVSAVGCPPLKQVQVVGAVNHPGPITFHPSKTMTLGRAIELAGGLHPDARPGEIELQRLVGTSYRVGTVDLEKSPQAEIQQNDIVIVRSEQSPALLTLKQALVPSTPAPPPAATPAPAPAPAPPKPATPKPEPPPATGRVVVMGEVNREGILEVPLAGGMALLQVIAESGGFTRLARPTKVRIRRKGTDGAIETITIDAKRIQKSKAEDFQVLPGDTVFVPESIL